MVEWEKTVRQVCAAHFRKTGFISGFQALAAGANVRHGLGFWSAPGSVGASGTGSAIHDKTKLSLKRNRGALPCAGESPWPVFRCLSADYRS